MQVRFLFNARSYPNLRTAFAPLYDLTRTHGAMGRKSECRVARRCRVRLVFIHFSSHYPLTFFLLGAVDAAQRVAFGPGVTRRKALGRYVFIRAYHYLPVHLFH